MEQTLDVTQQIQLFEEFFELHYYNNIVKALQKGHSYVVVDFHDLAMHNIDLAQLVLDSPTELFKVAQLAVDRLNLQGDTKHFYVRYENLPESQNVIIRDIRSKHIGKFIQFNGVVRQKTDVHPLATSAKFECPSCGTMHTVAQNEQKFKEPGHCGCGRKAGFKLISKELIDMQKLVLEEPTDELDGGEQPKRFNLLLRNDLVSPISEKKTNPGSKIVVTGVVTELPVTLGTGGKSVEFDLILEGNFIAPVEEEFSTLVISEEEEKEIMEFAKSGKAFETLARNFAPTIYGHDKIKEALVLQMFGGVIKPRSDGVRTRGDIHILLIGDPGAAKSQLLKRVSVIAPKARFVSGKGASGAGLTASVVKDEFLKGWALEAGALVLANQGVACIDELDKMTDEDRSAMHEALEQQTITISKANIQATLKSETTVLAAANPKFGRFDPYEILAKQINLPPALMSRFDLIFPVRDLPNKEDDSRIANFILKLHQDVKRADNVEISTDFIKKYVGYAKRTCKPKLTDEALDEIQQYYVRIRNMSQDGEGGIKAVPITARQLEALVRLTESSAKTRLATVCTREDAQQATALLDYTLGQIGLDPDTGKLDIDRITTGVSANQRSHITVVREVFKTLSDDSENDLVAEEDIIREAEMKGIAEDKTEEVLQKLKKTGDIYEPKKGFYKST